MFGSLFDTSGFPPRWYCGSGWTAALGWTHIVADLVIFGCYLAIPITIAAFLLRRKDVPYPRILWLFVAFILTCGLTHLVEAVIFYQPVYRLSGAMKVLTAIASLATVVALFKVVPRVIALPQLAMRNEELERQVQSRTAQLETALVEARSAAKAKEGFLRTISHELRTPINGLIGAASMFDAQAMDPRDRELLECIRLSANTLDEMVGDLLDFERLEAGAIELERKPLQVHAMLARCGEHIRLRTEAKGIHLGVDCDPGLWVEGDQRRLAQVVLNLAGNAEKFTAAGAIRIAAEHDDERLLIHVKDTGCGMDDAIRERIFEAFTQGDSSDARRHGGVGLGLSIVRRMVSLMGGTVGCESEPGAGSTFTVQLPLPRCQAPTAAHPRGGNRPRRALVVDDNPINQQLCRLMLAELGWQVELAEDGPSAVAGFEAHPFQLVLMDLQMPGMDGFEATRRIRALEATSERDGAVVIAVSANHGPDLPDRCRAAGCDAFLAKPFDVNSLQTLIERTVA